MSAVFAPLSLVAPDRAEDGTVRARAPSLGSVRVSVVVPTYRRPALLRRCLQALVEQDLDADQYEIVIADDGPDRATLDVVRSMDAVRWLDGRHRPRMRYVAVTETQGPAGARNRGWQLADGEIVAFTDDDTIPARDWLRRGLEALGEGKADDFQGAPVAVAGRIAIDVPGRPTDYERDASRLSTAEFATANCFVRRAALEAIGGFDERFTSAWREDSDLHFALLGMGRVARSDRAIVRHPIRPARWGVSLSQQRKVMFDALLYKKHPTLYRERIRSAPRYDYYAIVACAIVALAGFVVGPAWLGVVAAIGWAAMTARFTILRLRDTSLDPRHVAEMIATSIAIPFVATWWRLVGAWKYRVMFI